MPVCPIGLPPRNRETEVAPTSHSQNEGCAAQHDR